ncbi:MAG: site-specific integrase [Thermoanaerobaculia bacterium]
MLDDLFPRAHARYQSLRLLGAVVVDFESWLVERGFSRGARAQKIRDIIRVERFLVRRGKQDSARIESTDLRACRAWYRRRNPSVAGTANSLRSFLRERDLLASPKPTVPSATAVCVASYEAYLRNVRGLSPSSVKYQAYTISRFLQHLGHDSRPSRLRHLTAKGVQRFVRMRGRSLSRGSLQHTVAHLRGFLRFLAASNAIRPGLDTQIDTPRRYRLERVPRSLPWSVVLALIQSVDRSTPIGLRDYAMFCLMATYGLRASQVVSLTLDDIHWRAGWIHVAERKNGVPLQLPLIDNVATALVRYLRRGRPPSPHREIFLRVRAPSGILKPTAVTETFQRWSRRSGLNIPYEGPHCIRHSYAVNLLRKGMSLKVIGDLLGHRTAESTCVYLRMDLDDLRNVALPIPGKRKGVKT